jgi:glycine dehydrogenase subunit 2
MRETAGTTGLIFNEPLLWEKGKTGRTAFSLPRRDVKQHPVDKNLKGNGPDFPDLSEVDIVRHYIRLSQWNFSVDSGMYPLGSCTMTRCFRSLFHRGCSSSCLTWSII